MSNPVGFSASYVLGQVHVRLSMALEGEITCAKIHDLKKLKADLDRDIERLYYSNPELSSKT